MRNKNKLGDSALFWSKAHDYIDDYLPNVRNASPNTIDTYKISLNSYIAFLCTIKGKSASSICLADFSQANITEYQKWNFKTKKLAPKTCNLRTAVIRSFLEYMSGEDRVQFMGLYLNSLKVKKVKTPEKPIEYYSNEQMSFILNAPDINTRTGRRNRALLCLLYDTGARVSEIVGLKLKDLRMDAREPYVTLFGKGRKYRDVPIMDSRTIAILEAYIREFHPGRDKDRPLFYAYSNNSFHALSTDTVSLVLKKCVEKGREAGIQMPSSNHCHMIRKTRGMDLYQAKIPITHIQQLFGHKGTATTTGFYVFATKQTLAEEIGKLDEEATPEKKVWKDKDILDRLHKL